MFYRLNAVKQLLQCPKMHLEGRLGTRDQARDYCMKEDTRCDGPWEYGVWSGKSQGRRTDLANACQLIKTGGLAPLVEEHPEMFVKYSRGMKELDFMYRQAVSKCADREVKTVVLWGPTGTGKTKAAMSFGKSKTWYKLDMSASGSTLWWDGYQGEDVLIMDDFYGWIPHGKLLNILDRYPLRLDVKGSHVWAAWKWVIITSNKEPSSWYLEGSNFSALERRLTVVHHFEEEDLDFNIAELFEN